jgi:hypothetical protein
MGLNERECGGSVTITGKFTWQRFKAPRLRGALDGILAMGLNERECGGSVTITGKDPILASRALAAGSVPWP